MRLFVVLIVLVASSCANAGEISDLYTKQQMKKIATERAAKRRSRRSVNAAPPNKVQPQSHDPIKLKEHGITEIGIELNVGWHVSPAYTFIVNSDGTFRFEGYSKVDHLGKWTGTINRDAFDELAKLIRDSDYMGLQDRYDAGVTDVTPTFSTVVQDGRRHIICDRFDAPQKLRAIEQGISGLLNEAVWDRQEPNVDQPEKNPGE